MVQVNRMWRSRLTEERVQRALLMGMAGDGVLLEDGRLMRKMGVGQEGGKRRRKHLREVWGWVLLHVDPWP